MQKSRITGLRRGSNTTIALAGCACLVNILAGQVARAADPSTLETVDVIARRHYVATETTAATKSDIPLIETPQAISVVTQDEIQLLQITNLEEATRYTAGIVSGSYGPDTRFDWLTLRGFTPTLYLDGLQLPTAAIQEAQSRLDTYALEEIEILKGPSSSLYGAVPPGGLVSMVSKRPTEKFFAEINVLGGNYSRYQGSFDTGGPIGDGTVLFRLTGLVKDSDTQVDFAKERKQMLAAAVTWKPFTGATFTLISHYQHDKDNTAIQYLPSQGTLTGNPNGRISTRLYISDPGYDNYARRTFDIGYDFDYRINSALAVHQNVKYTRLDVSYNTIYGQGLQPDLRTLNRFTYLVESTPYTAGMDTHLEYKADTGPIGHEILAGIDYLRSFDNSALGFGAGPSLDLYAPVYGVPIANPPISSQNIIHQDQTGAYVQEHAKLGGWVLTASGRKDWVTTDNLDNIAGVRSSQSASAFSHRIGLNYLFESGFAPYASYAKSFQPVFGNAFDGSHFKPTIGSSYEAGVKFQPQGVRALITADVFHIVQDEALTPDTAVGHTGFSVQTGQITSKGLELEATARLNDNLSLNGTYTFMNARTTRANDGTTGNRVLLVPEHQASVLADYSLLAGPLHGLGFGAGVRYVGDVYGDPTNAVNTQGFTLVDALVHYDVPNWRVAINTNNLFDKVYLTSCYSLDSCTYGARRAVMASVQRRW
ncbi:MAG: iron complex outerrane recepter protein [Gammaproteobacteria bacterium]|jgi:iron complex outermembrane receptor protein|nr:iron complex outerrane recepter protein [Gammaproteobacteria bacterium]